jgi:hypothetical protein
VNVAGIGVVDEHRLDGLTGEEQFYDCAMVIALNGMRADMAFDGRVCVIDHSRGAARAAFGQVIVPVNSLREVEYEPPHWLRRGRIRLVPRPGADLFWAAASAPLGEGCDPFFVDFSDRERGERLVRELRAAIASAGLSDTPAAGHLVEPLPAPLRVEGEPVVYDGTAVHVGSRPLPLAVLDGISLDRASLRLAFGGVRTLSCGWAPISWSRRSFSRRVS